MKMNTAVLFCLTLFVLCPLMMTDCGLSNPIIVQNQGIEKKHISSDSGYKENPSINIANNSDFADQASANSWNGIGSDIDPYIIEGLNITVSGTPPIQIENTTVFFEIRGCLVVGGPTGILLQNLTNARVWNNTIQDSVSCGLLVTESESVLVTNNTIHTINGADSMGMYSLGSEYCEFSNNTVQGVNGYGILADYSVNCSITLNRVDDCSGDGIRLRDSSGNNITLNEVTHSDMSGIKLGNSNNCRLEQNLVGHSLSDGISIEFSVDCLVQDNVLYESGGYSLDLAGDSTDILANTFYRSQMQGLRCQSDNNHVTQNNFIENNLAFSSPATWLDNIGINNDITGNYYDIWTWPDDDDDEIVDQPYQYGSDVEQSDNEPHVRAFQTDLMHILTKPRLIHPNETMTGEKFWGLIQLSWSIASDTFGHDASYNVSVSANGGSLWTELAYGLIDTNLDWNSSEFSESTEYKFKVVAQCTDGLISEYTTGANYEVKSHTLSVPTILTPNGSEIIIGSYEITWIASVESWDLLVTYGIYYSANEGGTWTTIVSSVEDTSIIWDVGGIPEGNQYLIRVVASSSYGLVAEDLSDSVFTISRANNTILIVAVAGGAIVVVVIVYALRRRGTV